MKSGSLNPIQLNVSPRGRQLAQAMVEFALILPLLLLILYGIVEFGRLMFIYSALVTASREGARYGTAAGELPGGTPKYEDCAGIRNAARRSAVLIPIPDDRILISYDRMNTSTNAFEVLSTVCPPPSTVRLGDRIIVQVSADFTPIVPLVNIPPYTINSITRRTILRSIAMGPGGLSGSTSDPTVSFIADAAAVDEGVGTAYVQIQLSAASTKNIVLPYTLSGSATYGDDYTIVSVGSVFIPAGQTTAQIAVAIVDLPIDGIYEGNEDIIFTLQTPTNADLGNPSVHTLTIQDNDQPPVVSFHVTSETVNESAVTYGIVVELSSKSAFPIEVTYAVTGGSATPLVDYALTPTGNLVFPPLTKAVNLVVNIVQDGLDENDETIQFQLMGVPVGPATVSLSKNMDVLTILDSDAPPDIYFVVGEQRAPEGVTAVVTAQLSKVSGKVVQVPFTLTPASTANGTGSDPDLDYTMNPVAPSTNTFLVINPGSLEASLKFVLLENNPVDPELDETIIVQMGAPLGGTANKVTPNIHILTIGPVSQPQAFFVLPTTERGESSGQTNITVQLTNVWNQNVTIPFSIDPASTATNGADFSIMTPSPLTIPAGGLYANILVSITPDVFFEPTETAVFKLGPPTNATLDPTRITHNLNILDDDSEPTVQFVVTQSSVSEGVGTATIAVQLNVPNSLVVTVPFSVSPNSTAILGPLDDYTYTPVNNTLQIPAGTTSAQVQVWINDDTGNDVRGEPDETVIFQMGTPTNAALGSNQQHTLTIVEDEGCPTNYSIFPIGQKLNVSFNYTDLDFPLNLSAARVDFPSSNAARGLVGVLQGNLSIFSYAPPGALTGSYVKVPDAIHGYYWTVAPPLVVDPTTLTFVFQNDLVGEGNLTLLFAQGCSKVLHFVVP